METELITGLQERAARALPARRTEVVDGWWLRDAPGGSWWTESVLPHAEHGREGLERLITAAEKQAAERGRAACFQITPGVCPAGLDTLLAERGYRRESAASLRTARVAEVRSRCAAAGVPMMGVRGTRAAGASDTDMRGTRAAAAAGASAEIRVDARPGQAWFDAWAQVSGHGADLAEEWARLERIQPPTAYASVLLDGQVAAVGRAVTDAGWAGLFGIATLPRARGRGAARAVLGALAEWAAGAEAEDLYLQVQRSNAPALRLYDRVGFGEAAAYHYRRAAH
ncbi:GNAT family N-acetyltransferase [Streptomyces coryli]|uniref:GNAT family N-acetyltransferase n=1 Tax=Streptomyces coryli TaxID=1128680 RepID=UPI0030B89E7A